MEVLDADIYQLYQQLLFGDTQASTSREEEEAAAAAAEEQAPMLGGVGDQMVINPAGYVEGGGSTLPPLQMPGGGGIWVGNGNGFIPGGGNRMGNGGLAAPAEDPLMQFGGEQLMHSGGVPDLPGSMQEQSGLSGADLSEFVSDEVVITSLLPGTNQAAEPNQPASNSSGLAQVSAGPPEMMSQMSAMEYPQRQADVPQAVPDNETADLAQMVPVAVERGDEVSTAWSEEENQLLLQGLSRFADQDNFTKFCKIALGLPKKTVIDVSYRVRWLSDLEKMKKAAKQAEVGPENSARRKITKGKGTEGASKENNKYPLSKEALDSKSAEDIMEENDTLLDQIEKMLKTGQAKDRADYFYHVKTSMDALQNKVSGLNSIMEGFTVDDKEWENVFKDRDSSLAAKGTTITPA